MSKDDNPGNNVITLPFVQSAKAVGVKETHSIPIDSLVEVEYEDNFGFGACRVVRARLWVVGWIYDPDGQPLYRLGQKQRMTFDRLRLEKGDVIAELICGVVGGFREEKLTVIPMTPEILSGEDLLEVENPDQKK